LNAAAQSGAPPVPVEAPREPDPSMTVVLCLRDKAPAVAAQPGPAEPLADLLLEQCRAETDALRASLVREHGEASAANIMVTVTNTLRMVARRALAQAHAAR
jgi:hypothetical protein